MKFIADSMLGRLAKWLRLLGVDTLYYPHIEDSLLLRIAREQDRTILTRDTRLVKTRGIRQSVLLKDNDTFKQLCTVVKKFDLCGRTAVDGKLCRTYPARCSRCNEILKEIPRERAQNHVPKYTFQTCSSFTYCASCDKYYWKGTHQENMEKKLSELLNLP